MTGRKRLPIVHDPLFHPFPNPNFNPYPTPTPNPHALPGRQATCRHALRWSPWLRRAAAWTRGRVWCSACAAPTTIAPPTSLSASASRRWPTSPLVRSCDARFALVQGVWLLLRGYAAAGPDRSTTMQKRSALLALAEHSNTWQNAGPHPSPMCPRQHHRSRCQLT